MQRNSRNVNWEDFGETCGGFEKLRQLVDIMFNAPEEHLEVSGAASGAAWCGSKTVPL